MVSSAASSAYEIRKKEKMMMMIDDQMRASSNAINLRADSAFPHLKLSYILYFPIIYYYYLENKK